MIFKQNMIVIITNGRLAGKKAVVLSQLDEQHILVAGVNRVPVPSEDYMPAWEKRRNEKFLTFIKKININHVLASRYKADIGLGKLDAESVLQDMAAKEKASKEVNSIMNNAREAGKAKWLFTLLKF